MHCRTSSNSHAHCSSTPVHRVYTQLSGMYGNMLRESGVPCAPQGFLKDSRCRCHFSLAGNRKHKIARHKSLAVRAKVRGPERGVDVIKTQSDLRAERREQLSEGNIWKGIQDAHQRLTAEDVSVSNLLGTGLLLGLTFGTAFQPTHNNGYLPVFDVWPFQVGPFLQSGLVPIVLAPIWVLYVYLQPLMDNFWPGDEEAIGNAQRRASSLGFLAADWAFCAAVFILSDVLYLNGAPHWITSVTLAGLAVANWKLFDGTKPGLLLGALLAVGAPAGEMFIVNILGWWHYDRPDLLGVPHWASWCYAAYGWGVGNVGRYLVNKQKLKSASSEIKSMSSRN